MEEQPKPSLRFIPERVPDSIQYMAASRGCGAISTMCTTLMHPGKGTSSGLIINFLGNRVIECRCAPWAFAPLKDYLNDRMSERPSEWYDLQDCINQLWINGPWRGRSCSGKTFERYMRQHARGMQEARTQ